MTGWLRGLRGRRRSVPAGGGAAESRPFVVVGIGNPGAQYAGHRHNVGSWAVNRLARRLGLDLKSARLAATAEGQVDGRRVLLVKPRTFVNESGRAVQEILRRGGIPPGNLVVIYDELDLPVGQVRVRAEGSHGGHNGMRSIIQAIGSQQFARIRIGIGRPTERGVPTRDPERVADYVLANPPPGERERLEEAAALAADAALALITDGVEAAMNRYNSERPAGSA